MLAPVTPRSGCSHFTHTTKEMCKISRCFCLDPRIGKIASSILSFAWTTFIAGYRHAAISLWPYRRQNQPILI